MKKNIVLLMTTVTVVAGLLTGCGKETTTTAPEVNTTTETETVATTETPAGSSELSAEDLEALYAVEGTAETEEDNSAVIDEWLQCISVATPVDAVYGAKANILGTYAPLKNLELVTYSEIENGYRITFTAEFMEGEITVDVTGTPDTVNAISDSYTMTLVSAVNTCNSEAPVVYFMFGDFTGKASVYQYLIDNNITVPCSYDAELKSLEIAGKLENAVDISEYIK